MSGMNDKMKPSPFHGRRKRVAVVACLVSALILASCDPGWVNPIAGKGEGTGTPPATTPTPEAQVTMTAPGQVAVSPLDDSVYVYDTTNCTISRIAAGQVTLVAGTTGTCGNTGDGGPALSATIQLENLQVGSDGQIYFSYGTDTIRRIATDGSIHAVPYVSPIASGAANIAGFSVDAAGAVTVLQSTIYPGSGPNATLYVSRIAADGTQTLVRTADNGMSTLEQAIPATATTFALAQWMFDGMHGLWSYDILDVTTGVNTSLTYGNVYTLLAASPNGTVYAADDRYLYRITSDGTTTVIAGNGSTLPGGIRQSGTGTTIPVVAMGAAVTQYGGLVFTSGKVVYRLNQPEAIPTPSTTAPAG